MRTKVVVSAVLATVAGTFIAVAPSASAESSGSAFSSRLVTLVNEARSQHGLRPLTVASGTTVVASGWSSHMAATNTLAHNPNLQSQLESHGSPNWTTYGENVGEGPSSSADKLFTAYMNSPEHRANILASGYRYIGIATVFSGTVAWNTMDFVDQYGGTTTAPVHHYTAPAPRYYAAPKPAPHPVAHKPATRPAAPHKARTRHSVAVQHVPARGRAAPLHRRPARGFNAGPGRHRRLELVTAATHRLAAGRGARRRRRPRLEPAPPRGRVT
jgi:uncharacterized protein YkwD